MRGAGGGGRLQGTSGSRPGIWVTPVGGGVGSGREPRLRGGGWGGDRGGPDGGRESPRRGSPRPFCGHPGPAGEGQRSGGSHPACKPYGVSRDQSKVPRLVSQTTCQQMPPHLAGRWADRTRPGGAAQPTPPGTRPHGPASPVRLCPHAAQALLRSTERRLMKNQTPGSSLTETSEAPGISVGLCELKPEFSVRGRDSGPLTDRRLSEQAPAWGAGSGLPP